MKLTEDRILDIARGSGHSMSLVSDLGSHSATVCPPTVGGGDYPYHTGRDKDGNAVRKVSLARPGAVGNHHEAVIKQQREENDPLISTLNYAQVNYALSSRYPSGVTYLETDVPNRIASPHIIFAENGQGKIAGKDPVWREAVLRGANQTMALLRLSPFSLTGGFWLATVKGGVQQPKLINGNITAATADQTRGADGRILTETSRGGFRKDPYLASVGDSAEKSDDAKGKSDKTSLGVKIADELRSLMGDEFIKGDSSKRGLSSIGLGNIGYKQDIALGISVYDIVRTTTLSLPLVRGIIRLGGEAADDIKVRAGLVALYLYLDRLTVTTGLHLRTGCELFEQETRLVVDTEVFDAPTVDEARALFEAFLPDAAAVAGWNGSVYALNGNSLLVAAADTEDE